MALVVQQAVGDRSASDAGSRLGTQRQAVAAAILEREHLLFDDIGELADRTLEQRGLLKQRHPQLGIAVGGEDLARDALDVLPDGRLFGQHIVHTGDRRNQLHGIPRVARARARGPQRFQNSLPRASTR